MTPQQYKVIDIALTNAHHEHHAGLTRCACFKVSDNKLGQDLVQDTFLKTWKYLLKGGKIELMKAFLYHVLNDLIIDEYRKKNKPASLDSLLEQGFEPSVDEGPKLIDHLDGKRIVLLIRELPVKYRKIMVMRYVKDMSLKEMSDINGQTKNTNAVQIYRGIEMVKELSLRK